MERMSSERDNVSVGADDPYSVSASSKFDREVTTAFLTFYADLCSGFRRFLFFINDVPFFNGSGFLKSKNLDEGAYNFLAKVIESRAFDGFLEQVPGRSSNVHLFVITNADPRSLNRRCTMIS